MKNAIATMAVLLAATTANAKPTSEVNGLKYMAREIAQKTLFPAMKNPASATICRLADVAHVAPAAQWYMDGEPVVADVFTGWIDGTNSFNAVVRENWEIHFLDGELVRIKFGKINQLADGYNTINTKAVAEHQAKQQRRETVKRLGKSAGSKRASKATRRIPAGMAANLAKSAAAKADIEKDERPIFVAAYMAALGY
jgi:hypothetical protein